MIFVFLSMTTSLMGQEVTLDRQVRMLALGDSYTIGESVEEWERWPHQLTAKLKELGMEADEPDYIATTGWTTRRLIQGIRTMLDESKSYNLVSILIGVNNQYQGIDISSYEPDLRTIIDRALEIVDQDSTRIFILSIPDYAYTPFGESKSSISEEIDAYNLIKRTVAAEYGITYIDITPISRLGLANPSLVALDGLHPSGKQYGEWVKQILPRLRLPDNLGVDRGYGMADQELKVYPNPAVDFLSIDSSRTMERILILNSLGQVMYQKNNAPSRIHIGLHQWNPGMYTLLLFASGESEPQVRKFIIAAKGQADSLS